MKKVLITILGLVLFLLALEVKAQDAVGIKPESFEAKIIEVEQEVIKQREDGSEFSQQNLKFRILNSERKGEEGTYYGISEIEVGDSNKYKVGDRVFIDAFTEENGAEVFYVVDYHRGKPLNILAVVFVIVVLIVGRWKGVKALISLVTSFFIIIKFILPQILNGQDPFIISLAGGLMIMFIIIYLTEGFNRKSHLAIISVLISLVLTLILAYIFSDLARLTGLSQEESLFLTGIGEAEINFRGLLLAGMLIGAIGVLDDIILGQIEAVASIKEANPKLPPNIVFKLAYRVGNTHLGAIINTLFLTYAGASLSLLLLLHINMESGLSISRAINTEVVTTEIIRTLVGSIGVMASMPIATFLASRVWKKKEEPEQIHKY